MMHSERYYSHISLDGYLRTIRYIVEDFINNVIIEEYVVDITSDQKETEAFMEEAEWMADRLTEKLNTEDQTKFKFKF